MQRGPILRSISPEPALKLWLPKAPSLVKPGILKPSSPHLMTRRGLITGAAAIAACSALGIDKAKGQTVVSKTVGTNFPVGRDYPDPQTALSTLAGIYPDLSTGGGTVITLTLYN